MVKKIVVSVLALCCLLSYLTGCGKDTKFSDTDVNSYLVSDKETRTSEETNSNDNIDNWGVDESIITERSNKKARVYIKFPYLAGITKGQGKVAYQTDGSLVILGSESDFEEPNVDGENVENILSAYFEKIKDILKLYRQVDYSDYNFEIKNKEVITVNDYEMCKYTGKHTFTVDGNKKSISYVAYATKLKSNDAIVYWMVLDGTSEQSLGSTIESYADKMAKTLREESITSP